MGAEWKHIGEDFLDFDHFGINICFGEVFEEGSSYSVREENVVFGKHRAGQFFTEEEIVLGSGTNKHNRFEVTLGSFIPSTTV